MSAGITVRFNQLRSFNSRQREVVGIEEGDNEGRKVVPGWGITHLLCM